MSALRGPETRRRTARSSLPLASKAVTRMVAVSPARRLSCVGSTTMRATAVSVRAVAVCCAVSAGAMDASMMRARKRFLMKQSGVNGRMQTLMMRARTPGFKATADLDIGHFKDVLQTLDTTKLEPDVREHKKYEPGVGFIQELMRAAAYRGGEVTAATAEA